jgi:hypothetical protein
VREFRARKSVFPAEFKVKTDDPDVNQTGEPPAQLTPRESSELKVVSLHRAIATKCSRIFLCPIQKYRQIKIMICVTYGEVENFTSAGMLTARQLPNRQPWPEEQSSQSCSVSPSWASLWRRQAPGPAVPHPIPCGAHCALCWRLWRQSPS